MEQKGKAKHRKVKILLWVRSKSMTLQLSRLFIWTCMYNVYMYQYMYLLPRRPGDGPRRLASERGSLEAVSSFRRLIRNFFSSEVWKKSWCYFKYHRGWGDWIGGWYIDSTHTLHSRCTVRGQSAGQNTCGSFSQCPTHNIHVQLHVYMVLLLLYNHLCTCLLHSC